MSRNPGSTSADTTEYSFDKHWGHTAVGFASARIGRIDDAARHLLQSAAVPGDFRLRSYGPSFLLAAELWEQEQHEAVDRYLDACGVFWDSDQLRSLHREIQSGGPVHFPNR